MKKLQIIICSAIILIAISCNQSERYTEEDNKEKASSYEEQVSSDLGFDSITSTKRKIIHTADVSFKVKNVLTAITQLEDLTKSLGGAATTSNMYNEQQDYTTLPYSKDSLKEVISFKATAQLTLRVPTAYRDSIIKVLPAMAIYLEHRNISQSDASFGYLSNKIKTAANKTYADKINAKTKNGEEAILAQERNEANIDKIVDNYKIDDDVAFATIKLDIYEPAQTVTAIIANTKAAAQISFGKSLLVALSGGWYIMQKAIALFVMLWPLWLLIILIVLTRKTAFYQKLKIMIKGDGAMIKV